MSRDDDLGGVPLHDLFRMEIETTAATIDEGLVSLESAPSDPTRLESLMRAAHSAKGAARIVGVDPVVRIAHAMEDAFVAAQERRIVLGGKAIDVLLAANDLLKATATLDEASASSYLGGQSVRIVQLVETLGAISRGQPLTDSALRSLPMAGDELVQTKASSPSAPAAPSQSNTAEVPAVAAPVPPRSTSVEMTEGSVRVSAAGLGRMLAYAGEMLVESRRLETAVAALERLRRLGSRLQAAADRLSSPHALDADAITAVREGAAETRRLVAGHLETFESAARREEDLAGRLYREILSSRMRPFGDVVGGFPRLVRDLARDLGKRVRLDVVGRDVLVDRDVLDRLDAPLNHLLRNALDHGVEAPELRATAGKPAEARVTVEARHRSGMLEIEVKDDGRGVDYEVLRARVVEKGLIAADIAKELSRPELIEFLFLPGFSTRAHVTEISGRGVGLDVVQTTIRELGGLVRADAETGRGIRFILTLPITRSVVRAALVEIAGEAYAFPLTRIERVLRIEPTEIRAVEGREQFPWEGRPVGLVPAAQVLGLPVTERVAGSVPVVLVASVDHHYGLAVDRFLGEQDLVVRPLDARLGKVANVASVSVDEGGEAVLIVDVDDLLHSVDQSLHQGRLRSIRVTAARVDGPKRRRKRVLVVDDSITVREVERGLLSARGYQVDVAVDGMDGWNAVRAGDYDLVVSDVDMPRMDGIELVRRIRQDERLRRLPVMIVSYKDREADRARGLEAGASAYVTKSAFREEAWIARVVELVGEPEDDDAVAPTRRGNP